MCGAGLPCIFAILLGLAAASDLQLMQLHAEMTEEGLMERAQSARKCDGEGCEAPKHPSTFTLAQTDVGSDTDLDWSLRDKPTQRKPAAEVAEGPKKMDLGMMVRVRDNENEDWKYGVRWVDPTSSVPEGWSKDFPWKDITAMATAEGKGGEQLSSIDSFGREEVDVAHNAEAESLDEEAGGLRESTPLHVFPTDGRDYVQWLLCNGSFHSNLGGKGPDDGEAAIRYYNVATVVDAEGNSMPVDLVVETQGAYEPFDTRWNGLVASDGCFGQINVKSHKEGTNSVTLRFHFFISGTRTHVVLSRQFFTIYDIDGNQKSSEAVTFYNRVREVYIDPESQLNQTGALNKGLTFSAAGLPNNVAMPLDPEVLTQEQRRRAVTVEYLEKSYYKLTFSVTGGNKGRNFAFTGHSVLANPTAAPTTAPTLTPTEAPTSAPTLMPSESPTPVPTPAPTETPTPVPTLMPTDTPTDSPTLSPTETPTPAPTPTPTDSPTQAPTPTPTDSPTQAPTDSPTDSPTPAPTLTPTVAPTLEPTAAPSDAPTPEPTATPTEAPAPEPMASPSGAQSTDPAADQQTSEPTAAPNDGAAPPGRWRPGGGPAHNTNDGRSADGSAGTNADPECQDCIIWGDPHIITFQTHHKHLKAHPAREVFYRTHGWKVDQLSIAEEGTFWLMKTNSIQIQGRYWKNSKSPTKANALGALAIGGSFLGGNLLIIRNEIGKIMWNDQEILQTIPSEFQNDLVHLTYSSVMEKVTDGKKGPGIDVRLPEGITLTVNRWRQSLDARISVCSSAVEDALGQCGNMAPRKPKDQLMVAAQSMSDWHMTQKLSQEDTIFPDGRPLEEITAKFFAVQ